MIEAADEIFNYLPIDAGSENLYIRHLWGAFEALDKEEDIVRPFGVLPFHLLFMFSIQYKVYRLSAYYVEEYLSILRECKLYSQEDRAVLEKNLPILNQDRVIPSFCSVRNLSFIPEKQLFDFLRIINVEEEIIEKAKALVEMRSNYAHANGQVLRDLDEQIERYLIILKSVQSKCDPLNDVIAAEWFQEVSAEDDLNDFVEVRLPIYSLSQADFRKGLLSVFSTTDEVPLEDWQIEVERVLEEYNTGGVIWLRHIAAIHFDDQKCDLLQNLIPGLLEN